MTAPHDSSVDAPVILIVDDEADIRYVARLLLEEAGYTVLEASEGRGALDILQHGGIQLVITDIYMPGMDGVALLNRLRSDPATAQLPVIVWSERDQDDLDADTTFTKGLGIRALVPHVQRFLEGAA